MKDQVFIKRLRPVNEDHYKRPNDECKMAKIQLKSIIEDATEILENISKGEELDAWVQTLIATSKDDISAVRDYIVLGEKEEEDEYPDTGQAPDFKDMPAPVPMPGEDMIGPGPEVAGEEGDIDPLADVLDPEEEEIVELPVAEEPGVNMALEPEEEEEEEMEDEYPEESMEEYGMYESIKMPRLKPKI